MPEVQCAGGALELVGAPMLMWELGHPGFSNHLIKSRSQDPHTLMLDRHIMNINRKHLVTIVAQTLSKENVPE